MEEGRFVEALFDYDGSGFPSELSFKKGQTIQVLKENASGWWRGLLVAGGQKGLFPACFTSGDPQTQVPRVPQRGAAYFSSKFEPSSPNVKKIVVAKRETRQPMAPAPPKPVESTAGSAGLTLEHAKEMLHVNKAPAAAPTSAPTVAVAAPVKTQPTSGPKTIAVPVKQPVVNPQPIAAPAPAAVTTTTTAAAVPAKAAKPLSEAVLQVEPKKEPVVVTVGRSGSKPQPVRTVPQKEEPASHVTFQVAGGESEATAAPDSLKTKRKSTTLIRRKSSSGADAQSLDMMANIPAATPNSGTSASAASAAAGAASGSSGDKKKNSLRFKSRENIGKTIRGLFASKAQEAPAILESPSKKLDAETAALRRKERQQLQEFAMSREQALAAEKFKNQVSRIYDRENLADVRQVFDGLAGTQADDDRTGSDDEAANDELDVAPVVHEEVTVSRAALDLCSRSPKVFKQLQDTRQDRMRMFRELSQAERITSRELLFDDDSVAAATSGSSAGGLSNSALSTGMSTSAGNLGSGNLVPTARQSSGPAPTAAPVPAVVERKGTSSGSSLLSPQLKTRKRSGTANEEPSTRGRGDSGSLSSPKVGRPASAGAGAGTPDTAASPGGNAASPGTNAKEKSEEQRRVEYFSHCIDTEWRDTRTLRARAWVSDASKVPVLKNANWALVEVKDGEFYLETGKNSPCVLPGGIDGSGLILEDVNCYRFWMKDFFLNARHAFFLCKPGGAGEEEEKKGKGLFGRKQQSQPDKLESSSGSVKADGSSVLVVVRLGDEEKGDPSYVMAFHKNGSVLAQCSHSAPKQLEAFLAKSPLLRGMEIQGVRPYMNAPLDRHMLNWERGSVQRGFKFGVVYATNGQKTEDDMYSNEKGSEEFRAFLARLGNIIPLKGHKRYRAGLNVTQNTTGFLSVYNSVVLNEDGELLYDQTSNPNNEDRDASTLKFEIEVMFHVSTFLPFMADNPQQLHRKRHIGNDVCVVVFKERSNTGLDENGKPKEENLPIPPRVFTSQFNHVFIVVTPWKFDAKGRTTHYKVVVCCKEGVRPFRPFLPKNGIISVKKFTHWMLMKLINGERAAMYAKGFAGREARTSTALLQEALDLLSSRANKAASASASLSGGK